MARPAWVYIRGEGRDGVVLWYRVDVESLPDTGGKLTTVDEEPTLVAELNGGDCKSGWTVCDDHIMCGSSRHKMHDTLTSTSAWETIPGTTTVPRFYNIYDDASAMEKHSWDINAGGGFWGVFRPVAEVSRRVPPAIMDSTCYWKTTAGWLFGYSLRAKRWHGNMNVNLLFDGWLLATDPILLRMDGDDRGVLTVVVGLSDHTFGLARLSVTKRRATSSRPPSLKYSVLSCYILPLTPLFRPVDAMILPKESKDISPQMQITGQLKELQICH